MAGHRRGHRTLDFFRPRFAILIWMPNHSRAAPVRGLANASAAPWTRRAAQRGIGFIMLPDFRFMIGAALATLLLIVTVFGLAETVHIAQQAKISPLEPSRPLAYSDPSGWNQFSEADAARRFEGMIGADGTGRIPLREGAVPTEAAKPIAKTEERVESIPPQEEHAEAIPTRADAGNERAAISDLEPSLEPKSSIGLEARMESDPANEPAASVEAAATVEPATSAERAAVEAAAFAGVAAATKEAASTMTAVAPAVTPSERVAKLSSPGETGVDQDAAAKQAMPAAAQAKTAAKPKRAARAAKAKKKIVKRKPPVPASPPVAATGFPANLGKNDGWIF